MEGVMTYAQTFFGWLLQTTLVASLVICLILLIQKILGGRLGPRWSHALWLVLLIRMILPWAPPSRLSLSNLIPSWKGQVQSQQLPDATGRQDVSVPGQTAETSGAIIREQPESELATRKQVAPGPLTLSNVEDQSGPRLVSLRRFLPVLWLAGAIVIGAYLLMSNFTLWRIVKRDRQLVNQPMLELFEECKAQVGVESLVVVVPSSQIRSPALFGFIRPRLLLPSEMLEKASHEEMRYVFLHELAHLKRRDIYLGWLTSLLQVLHWFNPLVWYAFYRMRSDRELACDALVLARTQKGQSQEYGQAIVSLVRRFSRSRPLPAMAGILESNSQLKRRIAMITQFKKNSYQWSPLAVMLVVVLACISLPDARRTKASETAASKSTPHVTLRQIWSGPDVDTYGTPSADGRHLSYVDWETGDLALRELATGKTRRLTEKGGWEPPSAFALNSVISHDNKLVAYSWFNKHGTYDLCLIGVDGTGDRTLCSNKDYEVYPVSWSSDGKQIAARKYAKGGDFEIILVTVEDGSIQVLRTFTGPPFWPRFCYSPDDQFVVYDFPVADDMSKHDISLLSIDGNDEIPLIKHPANDRLLGWVPNREEVLFLSDRAGTQDLWVIQVRNGRPQGSPRRIKSGIGQISPMGFTENGSFYFNIRSRFFNTYIATSDLETGKILAPLSQPLTGSNFLPEWSPDGEYIAYVSEKTNPTGFDDILHVRSLKTGDDREVSRELNRFRNPRWSPDGRFILVSGYDGDNRQEGYNGGLYKVDVNNGNVTALVQYAAGTLGTGEWGRITGEWSPDGKAIFYINRESILMRQLESDREKQLYSDPNLIIQQKFRLLALSPDGQKIVFGLDDPEKGSKRLMIMPASGGKPHELLKLEESGRIKAITWTPDGKYVLFTKEEKKGTSLWRITPEEGYPQRLWESEKDLRGLRIHADRQQIAFYSLEKSGEVWVMENFLPEAPVAKPPGMVVRRVWANAWDPRFTGAPSPDGKYLSYVNWNTGDLAIHELATGTNRDLTNEGWEKGFALNSVFSPDSRQVAYYWWSNEKESGQLRIVGLDGSVPRVINRDNENAVFPTGWTPNGKHILTVGRKEDKSLQISLVPVEDGPVRVLKTLKKRLPRGQRRAPGLCLSPDGRYMAYTFLPGEDSANGDISVFAVEGSRDIPLVKHPADDFVLGWAPDGKRIVFASDRTGSMGIWALEVADGKPQGTPHLLKSEIGRFHPMGFTKNGSYYYGVAFGGNNVYVAEYDPYKENVIGKPVLTVKHYEGSNVAPDWSPDGRYLACVSRRPNVGRIFLIHSVETGQVRELSPDLKSFNAHSLRWSADGRFVLGAGKTDDVFWGVLKIDVETSAVIPIVEGPGLFEPNWSADGKVVFYISRTAEGWRILRRDLTTGEDKELLRAAVGQSGVGGIVGLTLSPDGKQLAFHDLDAGVLKVLSVEGGRPRDLVNLKGKVATIAWTPDGSHLLYANRTAKRGRLKLISADGGEPQKLDLEMDFLNHVRFHPDGRRITFTSRAEGKIEVWVMENFLPEGMGK